jgi:hypothetical protein
MLCQEAKYQRAPRNESANPRNRPKSARLRDLQAIRRDQQFTPCMYAFLKLEQYSQLIVLLELANQPEVDPPAQMLLKRNSEMCFSQTHIVRNRQKALEMNYCITHCPRFAVQLSSLGYAQCTNISFAS